MNLECASEKKLKYKVEIQRNKGKYMLTKKKYINITKTKVRKMLLIVKLDVSKP